MKNENNRCAILIPDGESHFLNYVINCLSTIPRALVYVMTSKNDVAIKFSRFVHHLTFYEITSDEHWISCINSEVDRHDIDVILPVFETGIRTLSALRQDLTHPNKLGLLPTTHYFDIAINKWSLSKHLTQHQIPHPLTLHVVSGTGDEIQGAEQLTFPVLLKPLEGTGGGVGIRKFGDLGSLNSHVNNLSEEREFIVQNCFDGIDFCSNVLCENGSILAHTIQKHIVHGTKDFAPQLGLQYIENEEINAITERLMKSLNWSGVANIDMRYDSTTGIYHIIEVNPRFWGSVEGSMLAGINFPQLYINTVLGREIGPTTYRYQEFFNLKGVLARIKKQPSFLFRWRWLWNETPVKFVLWDFKFYAVRIFRKLFSILRKKFF
ncbi:ATP-grasp domain-containing protein [Maribacter sp. 2307UL18-2]|uniref:ATP-grasp domain-containing protein n=1 Tax=Maribacter sp. 2307UL18-2 TaxID=3386274 RepID=UPI0039BD83D9